MNAPSCLDEVRLSALLARYPAEPASLIPVLQDVHREYGYLPCDALQLVASTLHVPLSRVFSVSTFYKAFSLVPQGKTVIKVCTGTACHIRGASRLLEELTTRLAVGVDETTPDKAFTIKTVNCVGACAMAPVLMVGTQVQGKAQPVRVPQYLAEAQP
jgi:NADH-quinone oxidoreductase subunit E